MNSSKALINATLFYLMTLENNGITALQNDDYLGRGLNVACGELVLQAVKEALLLLSAA